MRLVLCAEGPVEPEVALARYLREQPASAHDPVHLVFGMRRSPPPLPPSPAPGLSIGTFLPGRGLRDVDALTYHRSSYSEICRSLLDGSFAPDVLIACSTTPAYDGSRSLGGVSGYLGLVASTAPTVVLEEVPWLPHVRGAAKVEHATQVVASEAQEDRDQPHFSVAFDEVDREIAAHIARLIPRDPHLALGIGRVSDALAHALSGRNDVRITTGVVTETVRAMHDAGTLATGPIIAMSVVGPPSLLTWAASCSDVRLLPSTSVHDPAWLASHDRLVTVLGAIEVDLEGNVNCERVAGRAVSGRGGAPDFALGAHRSRGGLSIIALHSTGRGGTRLVSRLEDPSLPSSSIDAVVTEKGSAVLTGLTAPERALALRAVF
ncbi:MAG: 4-hydroxybutyrate CoA-transferase [Nocardioides sp.]|nr:4-hydroxybutyrate CoA-transferase [Nocardioides sp.]